MVSIPIISASRGPWTRLLYLGTTPAMRLLGAVSELSLICSGVGNWARSARNTSTDSVVASIRLEKALTFENSKSSNSGVGALIQRGGRAVAGMLTIATAGGS